MKTEIPLAIIMNVPWKSAQPVFAESRPEQQPDRCDNQATNKNESAQLVHGSRNKITLRSGFSSSRQTGCILTPPPYPRPIPSPHDGEWGEGLGRGDSKERDNSMERDPLPPPSPRP